ncbi:MAG: NAD(P)/FAD-dependent oxidoreductase [Ignavibacteriales bacterium]|nr:NAD(P)/FAD-dependent oxidoreductase [Ignavibacteriales bacterium]
MSHHQMQRREFINKLMLGSFALGSIDWSAFPVGSSSCSGGDDFDAIIIGSGLGGLSCAMAFARQGFKPLVIEQHDKPGGYATAFARPGGFVFDVSLHSTGVGERNGIRNLIGGFPEITDVEFLPHPNLYRAIYPHHDIRVAQRDPKAFIAQLSQLFPEEKEGIQGLFDDMMGLMADIRKLSAARGKVDMSRFPLDFPALFKFNNKSWGAMVDGRIKNPELKAIYSGQWGYYGLPPSKLSCFYYAIPFVGYLSEGGYYPKGRSQNISDAFVKYIEGHGGKVLLNTKVEKILVKDNAAVGVGTAGGKEYKAKVVVSNANAFDTFRSMIEDQKPLAEYEAKWKGYSVSLSAFQVFLGLKEDLVGKLQIPDSEIFVDPSYDPELGYEGALRGDVENVGMGVTLYDNIYKGYSPEGKNTLSIITLQGYGPWEKFEKDYFKGNKAEYKKEKERMADILIQKAEKALLPGLSKAIQVKDIATPLTNVRYTSNYRGAIYGWDQTLNNSGGSRIGHKTPIKNLYLAGAWSRMGHGYGAVTGSGLECFSEIMQQW